MKESIKSLCEKRKYFLDQCDDSCFVAPLELVRKRFDVFHMDKPRFELSTDEEMEAIGRILSLALRGVQLYNWMLHPIILKHIQNNRSINFLYLNGLTVDSEEKVVALCSLFENLTKLDSLTITRMDFSCEGYMLRFTRSLSKLKSINNLFLGFSKEDGPEMQFLQCASSLKVFLDYVRTSNLKCLSLSAINPSIKAADLFQAFLESGGRSFSCYGGSVENLDEIMTRNDISKLKYLILEQTYSNSLIEYILRSNPSLVFYAKDNIMDVIYQTGLSPQYLKIKTPSVDIFPMICNHIVGLTVETNGLFKRIMYF